MVVSEDEIAPVIANLEAEISLVIVDSEVVIAPSTASSDD